MMKKSFIAPIRRFVSHVERKSIKLLKFVLIVKRQLSRTLSLIFTRRLVNLEKNINSGKMKLLKKDGNYSRFVRKTYKI